MINETIKLAKGTSQSVGRCPNCKGPYDVVNLGVGWTKCPNCDCRLFFNPDGDLLTHVIG